MCDTTAAEGSVAYCPATGPFSKPSCTGGCCVSSGKCKLPFCKFNGLGADVIALDFICYGKNKGLFAGLNKCRNLACKLAVPGCKTNLMGGHCVGTLEAVGNNTDALARQYIGKPCIEIANHPTSQVLQDLPLEQFGIGVGDDYVPGLWTVCDCFANPSPVVAALPILSLKPKLLGSKLNMFKKLIAGALITGCQGPVCGLLPQLNGMNLTLSEVQIPMTLLGNLTALQRPKPLTGLPAIADMVPQIQLPVINVIRSADNDGLTLPKLPSFNDVGPCRRCMFVASVAVAWCACAWCSM
jgi:hypothetical protein